MSNSQVDYYKAIDEQQIVPPAYMRSLDACVAIPSWRDYVLSTLCDWRFWAILGCVAVSATGFGLGFGAFGAALISSPVLAKVLVGAVLFLSNHLSISATAVGALSIVFGVVSAVSAVLLSVNKLTQNDNLEQNATDSMWMRTNSSSFV